MCGLPAINGLYVSFFNILLYVLLGTSRHLSTGTYAIVSLIIANSLDHYEGVLYPAKSTGGASASKNVSFRDTSEANYSSLPPCVDNGPSEPDTSSFLSNDHQEGAVMAAAMLAFTTGLIHILFSVLHVGFVTRYLSDSIVGGFTCASALHVIVSQAGTLLGLKIKSADSHFVLAAVNINLK